MIRKVLFQVGIATTLGLGTIILVDGPIKDLVYKYLTTTLLQILGGVGLIALGLWLVKKYGKEFGMCK